MEALHLLLINLTNDPGFGGPGKLLLWPPAFAAGALPHRSVMALFSFEVSDFLPLSTASSSILLDLTVFCEFVAALAAVLLTVFLAGFIFFIFINFVTKILFTRFFFDYFNFFLNFWVSVIVRQ